MAQSKRSSELVARLRQAPNGPVDIVVELVRQPIGTDVDLSTPHAARVAALRDNFARYAEPVLNVIQSEGGVVQTTGWLNDTLYARVDQKALDALEDLDQVKLLDVPGDVTFPEGVT